MKQDMSNIIMNRIIANLTRGLPPCDISVRLLRTIPMAFLRYAYDTPTLCLRYTTILLLMLVMGVNTAGGQAPVEITTDADENSTIEDSEKKLYLIQTNAFPSFFIAPQANNTITTNNILGDYMLWYFLDAGSDADHQYYYIVSKSENKYICHAGGEYNKKISVK